MRSLCEAQGLSGVCELYRQHMADLLQWLSDSHHTWTSYSIQKTQLEIVAMQSGECVIHLHSNIFNEFDSQSNSLKFSSSNFPQSEQAHSSPYHSLI